MIFDADDYYMCYDLTDIIKEKLKYERIDDETIHFIEKRLYLSCKVKVDNEIKKTFIDVIVPSFLKNDEIIIFDFSSVIGYNSNNPELSKQRTFVIKKNDISSGFMKYKKIKKMTSKGAKMKNLKIEKIELKSDKKIKATINGVKFYLKNDKCILIDEKGIKNEMSKEDFEKIINKQFGGKSLSELSTKEKEFLDNYCIDKVTFKNEVNLIKKLFS
jgi:hypothetical protein